MYAVTQLPPLFMFNTAGLRFTVTGRMASSISTKQYISTPVPPSGTSIALYSIESWLHGQENSQKQQKFCLWAAVTSNVPFPFSPDETPRCLQRLINPYQAKSNGANAPADIVVQIVETSAAQTVGLTITDADVSYCAPSLGNGTVTSVGLNVPGGFTVAGTNPITTSGTFEITSALSGVIKADGSATFSGDSALNDLADVNVAQGAGNDGDLVYYDHAAGAGAKFKGAARSSIGLTEFDNDLSDSYLMLIESPTDKTYTIDARVAAARTITNFYAKTASGTCTATLKNLTDTTTIGSMSVTSTGGSASLGSFVNVDENDRLGIEITSSSSPADLEMVVEFTG